MESVHRWCWSVLHVCRLHRYFCNLGSSWESRSVFVILGVSRSSIRARGRSDKNLSRNRPHAQKNCDMIQPIQSILKAILRNNFAMPCEMREATPSDPYFVQPDANCRWSVGAFATAYLAFEPTVLGRQCSSSSHKPTQKVIRCSHAGRTAFWKLWRYARKHLGRWINKIRPMKPTI